MSIRACLLAALGVLAAAEPGPPASSLRVDTGDALHWLEPGHEQRLALVVANPRAEAVRLRLSARLHELEGAARELALECEVPARGETRLPLELGSRRQGIRYLDYRLEGAGLAAEEGRTAFLYAAPVGGGPDPAGFLYGVSSHPDRNCPDAEREPEMIATARAGLGVMRIDSAWSRAEPRPGTWDWSVTDRLVELGTRHGVAFQVVLAYGHSAYASPAAQAAYAEAKRTGEREPWAWLQRLAPPEAPWRAYVAAAAARYRGQVRLWEVWNEPDLFGFWRDTPDAYIAVLRAAADELRRADPANQVLTGGFATVQEHAGHAANPDLQERVLAEAGDAFDLHAFHGHGPFAAFRADVDGELARLRARLVRPRPLYFNETAISSVAVGERVQAWTLVKKLAFARARGAVGYTWYDLRNDGWNPKEVEHHYGLLQRDFRPKAAYAACVALTRLMRGTAVAGELALGPGRLGYVFAAPGRRLAVLWNEDPGLGDGPIALRAPGCPRATAYDLMGNPQELPVQDGVVVVQPGAAPSYLELAGDGGLPQPLGALVEAETVAAAPGERVPVTLRLTSPLAAASACTLAWDEDGGERTRRLELPGAGAADAVLGAAVPAGTRWNAALAQRVRVAWEGLWTGTVTIPVQVMATIPAGDPAGRPADFILDAASAVVNFTEADPTRPQAAWQGPHDLSARVWLARGGGALRIHVEVSDERHRQPHPARASYLGDGLQLAFQVPGQRGHWELGAARADDGTALAHVWLRPAGSATGAEAVAVATEAIAGGVRYRVELSCAAFGLDDTVLERGLRFNLIANDDDGEGRKQFIRIAPGIGESKDPAAFPRVRFAPAAGGGR
ncbi:MAG: hypothetical protein L6R48_17405 [Planctomycetes bacterium]|nr:hypothetical protein [Planctomycetota bacterium]